MYLEYNFIKIQIEGQHFAWKKYISGVLTDQIDFSCGFATAPFSQNNLVIKIRRFSEISNYPVTENVAIDYKMRMALDFNDDVLSFYCGFDKSISLSYIINLALLKAGRGMLLHCAALEHERGGGHVYSALGGAGKTRLALNAVSRGKFRLLGDDLVICTSEGILYPYLRPLCLYSYHYSLLEIQLPRHHFVGPDFIYKIARRISHFTLRWFGTKKWFTKMRGIYTSRNLSNDVSPSSIFAPDKLSNDGVKLLKLYAVTGDGPPGQFEGFSFDEFVLNTTLPEWEYFDRLSDAFFKGFGETYRNVMFVSIKKILKNVEPRSMRLITKSEIGELYV